MKWAAVPTLLTIFIALTFARSTGKDYEKEKICGEYAMLGKENFRIIGLMIYSRKFPNSTFEEVSAIVKETVALAERCCAADADPNCYEEGSNAISVKSCDEKSPFPKHPGISECCTKQGLELKLCLAALQYPPLEIPSSVEPSNEELCQSFKENPHQFTAMHIYEFSRRFAGAPVGVLHNATAGYLKMFATCCTSPMPNKCFTEQVVLLKESRLFAAMAHAICLRNEELGPERFKTRAVATYAQKIPNAELSDLLPVALQLIHAVSLCCKDHTADCLRRELNTYKEMICTGSLIAKSEKLAECCDKRTTEALACVHYMETAESIPWDETRRPSNDQLCSEGPQLAQRVAYEFSRTQTKLPVLVLSKIFDAVQKMGTECCSAEDSTACFNTKRPQMKQEMNQYLKKANELCLDHNTNLFTVYKQKVQKSFHEKYPEAAAKELKELVEKRTTFASTCCGPRGPVKYCANKFETLIGRTCDHDSCFLS